MRFSHLISFILSVCTLSATTQIQEKEKETLKTPSSSPSWTIKGYQTNGISSYEDLKKSLYPDNILFELSKFDGDIQIPSRPYDISNIHSSRLPAPALREAWDKAYQSNNLLIAHGFSGERLQSILKSYFETVNGKMPTDLTATEVLELSPFVLMGVRNIVSGCLLDMNNSAHQSTVSSYNIGFLLKAPQQCIHKARSTDAYVVIEGNGTYPQNIRRRIENVEAAAYSDDELNAQYTPELRKKYEEYERTVPFSQRKSFYQYFSEVFPKAQGALANKFEYSWEGTPEKIIKDTKMYNEIAFVPRVSNSDHQISIVGIYYKPSLMERGFGYGIPGRSSDLKDSLTIDQTINILQGMAKKMNIPLINLEEKKP